MFPFHGHNNERFIKQKNFFMHIIKPIVITKTFNISCAHRKLLRVTIIEVYLHGLGTYLEILFSRRFYNTGFVLLFSKKKKMVGYCS